MHVNIALISIIKTWDFVGCKVSGFSSTFANNTLTKEGKQKKTLALVGQRKVRVCCG